MMKGILEALVGIGAMYCGIAGGEWCVEVSRVATGRSCRHQACRCGTM